MRLLTAALALVLANTPALVSAQNTQLISGWKGPVNNGKANQNVIEHFMSAANTSIPVPDDQFNITAPR